MNKPRYASMVTITLLLPFVGAAVMYAIIFAFPMGQDSIISHFIYTLIIITLGLGIPYSFLKSFSIAAHEWDEHEPELHIEDLPKDKDDYENTLPH